MSKQANHVNIEPEICMKTGLQYMNYNFFANPFTSCNTDIIISHHNTGHTYMMQELVEEVTPKHNNGVGGISNYIFLIYPFSFDAYQS